MKAVVAAFNQEKALVGAFSVITNLRMELFEALVATPDTAPLQSSVGLNYTFYLILRSLHHSLSQRPPMSSSPHVSPALLCPDCLHLRDALAHGAEGAGPVLAWEPRH